MRDVSATALVETISRLQATVTTAWLLEAGALVLLMQAGFALLTCGLVRRKNAAHLVMLNLAAFVLTFLAYYAVGYGFQFGAVATTGGAAASLGIAPTLNKFLIGSGSWGFLGGRGFLLSGPAADPGGLALALFKGLVMATTGFIIVGAICERVAFWAFVLCEVFVGALLYPAFGCWVWGSGWLSQLGATMRLGHGYVDFAGSTVVHAVGGFCAMALALILGPRIGKFGPRGEPRAFPAHNVVYVVVGTLLLLAGWTGFNAGSTLGAASAPVSLIGINTLLAGAAGSAAAMVFWYLVYGLPDISMACNGLLAGLVAIAAPCAFIGPNAAVLVGLIAGVVASAGVLFNDRVLKVDDPCGAIAVHGYCGWLGAVAVGIFANGSYGSGWNGIGATAYFGVAGRGVTGLLYGDPSQFLVQLAGATLCALYAFGLTYLVFRIVHTVRGMRVSREVELEGLDLPEFGMLAYPEEGSSAS